MAATDSMEVYEAPRFSCSLAGAFGATLGLFGGVPILHSGAGCGLGQHYGMTFAAGLNAGGPQGTTNTPCSCLVEEHVIFGGEDKLRKLIASTIELMEGDLYVVISGCVPALIGDDVAQVTKEFRDQTAIFSVDAPGFSGNTYLGYELFLQAAAAQLLETRPVQKGLVTILGIVPYQHIFWKGSLAVVKQALARIGVEANVLFCEFGGLENLRRIPAAELNLVLSPWNGHTVATDLEERFGTPWIDLPGVPVGPKQTAHLLRAVAAQLGIDPNLVERVIAEEERHTYRFMEYVGDLLVIGIPQAYLAVVADSGTAIGVIQFLTNEAGSIPDIVILTDDPPEERRAAIVAQLSDELNTVLKPEVVFEVDSYRIRQKLRGRTFSFLLASSQEKYIAAEEFKAIHHSIAFPAYDRMIVDRSYAGWRGGLNLLEDLVSKFGGPL
ncbi:MAG: nitrogenase [Chloroflexales bacterium]|nr:nitrogenase [Chloroflexales bacterium]